MNAMDGQHLQYVKNTGGGATKQNFFEDWEPIGEMAWNALERDGLVLEGENGKIYTTAAGEAALAA